MKTGLVFSGGGSRGAYQVGVWKALNELDIKCDIVTGTSIGSINAAIYVQGDLDNAIELWKQISFKSVFEEEFDYKSQKDKFKVKLKYLKSSIKGGIEPSNLKDLITKNIDLDKFYNSSIDYGLVTVTYPKLKVIKLTKKEINKDKLIDYIIASSTVFPMFKVKEIDNNKYVDGGFKDAIPVDLAIKLGADKIIAVDISLYGRGRKNYRNLDIITIKPRNNLGRPLTFDSNISKKNINYGYNDTMKSFKKYFGKRYTFSNLDSNLIIKGYFRTKNKLLNIMEHLGKIFDIDDNIIYSTDEFNKELFDKFDQVKLKRKINPRNIIGPKERIKYIYKELKKNDKKELLRFEKLFLIDYKAAYYIYVNKNNN